jgi:two-component system, OmpR family, alkaline phosphatase synthesis response regulator PhoP
MLAVDRLENGVPWKILVCDDEHHIVRLIQVNLERKGFKVVAAFDGKECLEKIRGEKPDVVVLDVLLPGMGGLQVLDEIRRNPETENLPVIVVTAKVADRDVYEGYQRGADMYLIKPFDPMDLIQFLESMLLGRQSPQ